MKNKILNFLIKYKYGLITLLIGSIFAFLDLFTKYLTTDKYLSIIDGFISIYSSKNTGGAWSIFSNHTLGLNKIKSIFIIFLIIFNYFFKKKNILFSISFGLILSGAVCNLYDRIFLGYVRDFIKLEFINFPIFNIADSAICVGVFLICLFFLFFIPKNKEEK